jgi:sugar/nucleoside kinase (ribokinase family)
MIKYDIVTIGDCSEDIFVKPHNSLIQKNKSFTSGESVTFELGEKINLDQVSFQTGGSAGNAAVAFSRLGYHTAIISSLGFDTIADKIITKLQHEDVDIEYLDQKKNIASSFSIVFNFAQERTIFVYHGLDDYAKLKLPKKLPTSWIYLAPVGHGEDAFFDKIVALSSEKNIKIAWNPGARQIEKGAHHYRSLLKMTDILSLNKEEAIKFTDFPVRPDIRELSKRLHQLGAKLILITDGPHGAYCSNGADLWQIDVLHADRVDATGAGDSFTSAFVSNFIENEISPTTIESALRCGIVESTSVVTQVGAQTGLLTKTEMCAQLEKNSRLRPEIV